MPQLETVSSIVDDGDSLSNSPSHFEITTVARQFPMTFTDVRAMSISWSMPKIIKIGSTGRLKLAAAPSKMTRLARGTPATPLLVSISVNTIKAKLGHLNAITISGWGLLFAAIPYSIYLFFQSDFLFRLQNETGAWTGLGYIATLGIMSTALSNLLYFHMVKISSPLFASAVTYFIPMVALGWGVMDGEQLHLLHLVAFTFILGGVALISYRSSKPNKVIL